jgi:hypothetical protein
MTELKPTSRVILGAETGDPLLAAARYGLGMGMAFPSDLTDCWGGKWLAWEECGKFWAQALRIIVRKIGAHGMSVFSDIANNTWQLDISRRDPNRIPVSKIEWDAQALDPKGKTVPVTVRETGLGRYRAGIPLECYEKLTLRGQDEANDRPKVLHYHRPSPREYALSTTVPTAIANLPEFTW